MVDKAVILNGKIIKVKRLYEDDNWIIDKIGDNIRVSYFKDFHFVDERLITKEEMGREVNNYNEEI